MRNIVPLLFLIVATVANCSDWSKAQPRTWKRSQKYTRNFPRQTGKIDYKKFEEALPTDQDPFLHTKVRSPVAIIKVITSIFHQHAYFIFHFVYFLLPVL